MLRREIVRYEVTNFFRKVIDVDTFHLELILVLLKVNKSVLGIGHILY